MKINQSIVSLLCPANHALFGDTSIPFHNVDFKILESSTLTHGTITATTEKVEMLFTVDMNTLHRFPADPFKIEEIIVNAGDFHLQLTSFFATLFEVQHMSMNNYTVDVVIGGYCTLKTL